MRAMIWDKKKGDFFTLFGIRRIMFLISLPEMKVEMEDGTELKYKLDEYELYLVANEQVV